MKVKPINKLTVLSFGAGQDSTALLYKYVYDASFRLKYAPEHFNVVISDTGDEHEATYTHINEVTKFCQKHSIEFYFLVPQMGFHPNTWPSLIGWMKKIKACFQKLFQKVARIT